LNSYDSSLLEQWNKQYVWHPFTQMQQYLREKPLIIERGEGSYLIDVEGNRYLDGVSSLWVTVHGHCHPELTRAIKEQLDLIAHSTLLGIANVPSIWFPAPWLYPWSNGRNHDDLPLRSVQNFTR